MTCVKQKCMFLFYVRIYSVDAVGFSAAESFLHSPSYTIFYMLSPIILGSFTPW